MVVKPATPSKVVGTTLVETMVLEAKDTDVDVLVRVTSEELDEVPVGGQERRAQRRDTTPK